MKKGKIISMPTSTEAQIIARARNLPVGKCYINDEWDDAQMASVIVSRKHVNGNVTYGFYLVDLNLLGVKDCFYAFNQSPVEMEEYIHNQMIDFVECDYALAHNIIYEGIAFAEDFGFKPVKEFFKTGIYILEEDTDDIPEMDIPLGKDGVPVVFTAPNRNMQREIAILEKTAGPGNFIVCYMDDEGNLIDIDDDDEYDDEEDDEYDDDEEDDENLAYEDITREIENIGIQEYMAKYGDDLTTIQILALTDLLYCIEFDETDVETADRIFDLIIDDDRYDPELDSLVGLDKYNDSLQSILNGLIDDADAAHRELEALVHEHSDDPELGIFQMDMLRDLDLRSELEQLTLHWYNRAPDHYAIRLLYAQWLTEMERFDEVFALFGNCPGLDALTTENKPFTDVMVSEFCACYVQAWLSKNQIEKAEPYYQILILLENWTSFVMNALLAMMSKKKNAVLGKKDSVV